MFEMTREQEDVMAALASDYATVVVHTTDADPDSGLLPMELRDEDGVTVGVVMVRSDGQRLDGRMVFTLTTPDVTT